MRISVRYFARLREALGPGEDLDLPTDGPDCPRTVGDLRQWLARRSPVHAEVLAPGQAVRSAFNQAMCAADQPLQPGSEVAFFPPVTGG